MNISYPKNDNKNRKHTTKGWYFEVKWKDGTTSWVPLKEIKENHPIETAEYAKFAAIIHEPALAWWAPHVLSKRDQIIAKVISRTKKKTHKYGVQVPTSVDEAYQLDKYNGNDYWRDAIKLEMANIRVAFDILEDDKKLEPGRIFLECCMIFEVKMDFRRKARYVANGAKTPNLTSSAYAGVVSRESIRIAFTLAALNGLNIMTADIQNAYLQAPISEK